MYTAHHISILCETGNDFHGVHCLIILRRLLKMDGSLIVHCHYDNRNNAVLIYASNVKCSATIIQGLLELWKSVLATQYTATENELLAILRRGGTENIRLVYVRTFMFRLHVLYV